VRCDDHYREAGKRNGGRDRNIFERVLGAKAEQARKASAIVNESHRNTQLAVRPSSQASRRQYLAPRLAIGVHRRIGWSRGTLTALLILAIVVLGLVAGWVAQIVLGSGGRQIDWGLALVAGLVGSFVGGLLASLIAGDGLRLRPSGLIGSIVGAVLVTAAVRMMRGRSRA
jgi:uncharacterized membrane protein YeaQ/YmgE (transglycosylase-associated protein family)